ncbi:MAG: tyrosine-type recombinase/integrase [Flavobacteriales bacterium]
MKRASIRFNLKKRNDKQGDILVSISYKGRYQESLGRHFNISDYKPDTQRLRTSSSSDPQNAEINQELDEINLGVKKVEDEFRKNGDFDYKPKDLWNRYKIDKGHLDLKGVESNKHLDRVVNFWEWYLVELKKKGKSSASIKVFRSQRNLFIKYFSYPEIRFKDLTSNQIEELLYKLLDEGYRPKSVEVFQGILGTIINKAKKKGIHEGSPHLGLDIDLKVQSYEISLSREQFSQLENARLTGTFDLVRDMFVCGMWLGGARYGDWTELKLSNVYKEDNKRWINYTQSKTGQEIDLPVEDWVYSILKKYPDGFPSLTNDAINENLKAIGKALGWTQLIKTNKGQKPFYEKFTSHVARRTFATHMYHYYDLDPLLIMTCTGHKTSENFKKYIRLDTFQKKDKARRVYQRVGKSRQKLRNGAYKKVFTEAA